MDFLGEALRLVHLLEAGALDVELPAVIDAAQPGFLIASVPERDPAMRAELVQQADSRRCHGRRAAPRPAA